jgi:uncharacterized protein DUF559
MRARRSDPGSVGRTPRIPDELKRRPFSLDEARSAGISLSALRGKSWQRVGYRLYRWIGAGEDPWRLIDAVRRDLPKSAVFVGGTAAWMHCLDVAPTNPIQVALPADCRRFSREGLDVRHVNVAGETLEIKGSRVTSMQRTLLDLCANLPPVDALVAIDMACHARLTDKGALGHYADNVKGRRGVARLRQLAALAAPAESPMETRLRWLLIKAGLPVPEVQTDLYDDSGEFLGRADLYYPQAHLVIEFDGGNHRDRLVSDDRRQNSLIRAGYRILRFTTPDVYGRPLAVVTEVRGYLSGR